MSTEQNSTRQQIINKAMTDEAFRQELLSNPKTMLARELNISIPEGMQVYVYEDTPTTLHLVLPLPPQPEAASPQELSDDELLEVVGGAQPSGFPPTPEIKAEERQVQMNILKLLG